MVEKRSANQGGAESEEMKSPVRWLFTLLAASLTLFIVVGVALTILYAIVLVPRLPSMREVKNPDVDLSTIIYSADGQEIARYYSKNRMWITFGEISPAVVDALIATEDHRFYEHWGIDVRRLISSAYKSARGERQGGSTITMQLARNLYPEIQRSWIVARKLKEIMTAFKIERNYKKTEILEMYLNTVPFGYDAYGIEAAARTYFDKPASDLTVEEAATLVGMLKATTRYNPVLNPEMAQRRRNVVLAQMAKRGYLDAGDYIRLRDQPTEIELEVPSLASSPAPHFAEYVRRWLDDWAERNGYDIYRDGLRVYTTLDTRIQAIGQLAIERQMEGLQAVVDYEWSRPSGYFLGRETAVYERYKAEGWFEPFTYFWNTRQNILNEYLRATPEYRHMVHQGIAPDEAIERLRSDEAFIDSLRNVKTRLETGLVAIDPNTGEVKAWIGGRDFTRDQYDKVAMAKRQPGSTFKPFVYTAAIDLGYSPYYTVQDTVRTFQLAGSTKTWTPRNAGGSSGREVSLRDGLAYSINTVTAYLMSEIGPYRVANYAHNMGIRSELERVPSLALGTSEVTLLELVSAYSTLASYGIYREPVVVKRIEDKNGHVLSIPQSRSEKVLSTYTAYTVLDMMRDVIERGTGSAIRWKFGIQSDVAGKTGTSQEGADGWFVLMHPNLITGAWVGFNDRRITFRSSYWGQGGHNALHVVGDFFRLLQQDPGTRPPDLSFNPPPGYREPLPPDSSLYRTIYVDEFGDTLSTDAYLRSLLDADSDSDSTNRYWSDSLNNSRYFELDVEESLRRSTHLDSLMDIDSVESWRNTLFQEGDLPDSDVERALRDSLDRIPPDTSQKPFGRDSSRFRRAPRQIQILRDSQDLRERDSLDILGDSINVDPRPVDVPDHPYDTLFVPDSTELPGKQPPD